MVLGPMYGETPAVAWFFLMPFFAYLSVIFTERLKFDLRDFVSLWNSTCMSTVRCVEFSSTVVWLGRVPALLLDFHRRCCNQPDLLPSSDQPPQPPSHRALAGVLALLHCTTAMDSRMDASVLPSSISYSCAFGSAST